MSILYLLIPLAMLFALVVGMVLLWAIRSGQYDDLEGPAHRILMDDDDPRIPTTDDEEKDHTSDETRHPEDRPR
ncbi:cbb3-type cytochrome oxidase assembly protein CcoS [Thioalkalivibrio sp. HL-Eb18]|jgi:cbb3-type cytochrome oxidase maturation protein|uniref:cbb3-type cytochrome oxidase assembly protein CcoS n=1 Tax=Thioalkalivibrio sp. HL-Eb18 TaxID=1266913 RepID=UPI000363EFED|nr:cbb3-type cytochrome oxidase assembly protein CcoS [Thioalkalivibrio sp. HL-Eb18]